MFFIGRRPWIRKHSPWSYYREHALDLSRLGSKVDERQIEYLLNVKENTNKTKLGRSEVPSRAEVEAGVVEAEANRESEYETQSNVQWNTRSKKP